MIQFKNPALWKRIFQRKEEKVSVEHAYRIGKGSKINPRENSKHIYEWVAPFKDGFLNNRSLFAHLEPVYNFICESKYKNFEDVIVLKELQSFSQDISIPDLNNWFLPRYKILLKVLSSKTQGVNPKGISQVFQTFQALLVSHYSHRLDSDTSFKKTFVDVHVYNFIAKFLFNKILLKKNHSDPKWVRNFYHQETNPPNDDVDCENLCSLHFTTVYSIINVQLIKIKTNQTLEPQLSEYISVLKIIEHIFAIIESLIHVLVRLISKHEQIRINHKRAYCQVYLERELSLRKTYLRGFYSTISAIPKEELQGLLKMVKIVILSLLAALESIEWKYFTAFLEKFPAYETSLQKKRAYIQAALLVTTERNLIARFRLSGCFNNTTST